MAIISSEKEGEKLPRELKELSALDLRFLLKEISFINNGKIENVYQQESTLFFMLYCPDYDVQKQILVMHLPEFIFTTTTKSEMPQTPAQFCMNLRKMIKGAKIQSIEQIDFERVLDICIVKKDVLYHLMVELYGLGNAILCNESYKIIYPLRYVSDNTRPIKGGIIYTIPRRGFDPAALTQSHLHEMLSNTKLDSIVTFLAKECGFGGRYAEQICVAAKVDKKESPAKCNLILIFNAIQHILSTPQSNINSIIKDSIIQLEQKKEAVQKQNASLTLSKTERIVLMQKDSLQKYSAEYDENIGYGEKIYAHYPEIKKLIDACQEVIKSNDEKSVEKLKMEFPGIIDIDLKKKTLTLDLE